MQKILFYILIIGIVFTGTSCKSVRKVTQKDDSTNTNNRNKKKRKVEFIDDIEVAPGSVVKSKHKPSTTKSVNTIEDIPENLNLNTTKSTIESANKIQLKYAITLNTYVENLSNVKLYNTIDEWMGTRYCYGGNSKSCIDCSAFTGTIFRNVFKIDLPRTAREQYSICTKVKKNELKEGDLVFFNTRGGISHVGVYLHNNKFVHASTSSGVMISDLDDNYWGGKYAGAGRTN